MKKLLFSVLLIAFSLTMIGCSATDYKAAQELFEQGQYEDAQVAFEALGNYKDSAAKASNCKVKICEALIDDFIHSSLMDFYVEESFIDFASISSFEYDMAKKAFSYYSSLTEEEKALVSNKQSLPSDEAMALAEKNTHLISLKEMVIEEAIRKLKSSLINSSSYQPNPDRSDFALASWSETNPNEAFGYFTLYYSATNSFGGRVDATQHGMYRAIYENGFFTLSEFYFTDY